MTDSLATAPTAAVGLINAYSTLNLGDAAIYSGLRALMPSISLQARVQDSAPDRSLGITFLDHPPCDCRAYVSVGGDIFNNSREWLFTKTFLRNLAELRHAPERTILFGQSIPRSCHGLSFLALCRSLRRLAAVCVRDAQSHSRLGEAGVDVRLSFDTAFVLEPTLAGREVAASLLAAAGLEPAHCTVLSVRAFDSMYAHDNDRFVEQMASLCRGLNQAGLSPAILIQSRAYGADNDLEIARSIVAAAPETAILDPFLDQGSVPSWQIAMGVFELVERVVAVRYHTAVLALCVGKIPYHLHYSNKGQDICRRLHLPGENLGRFEAAAALKDILKAPSSGFDHHTLRAQVREDFDWCMARLMPLEPS